MKDNELSNHGVSQLFATSTFGISMYPRHTTYLNPCISEEIVCLLYVPPPTWIMWQNANPWLLSYLRLWLISDGAILKYRRGWYDLGHHLKMTFGILLTGNLYFLCSNSNSHFLCLLWGDFYVLQLCHEKFKKCLFVKSKRKHHLLPILCRQ